MGGGPDGGPMGPIGPNTIGSGLNGEGLDGMKSSPANGGPGTPREDSGSGMGDYNLSNFGGPGENVSLLNNFTTNYICHFSLFLNTYIYLSTSDNKDILKFTKIYFDVTFKSLEI